MPHYAESSPRLHSMPAPLKIESGIPLPPRSATNHLFPFRDMVVGDSVFIPLGFADKTERNLRLAMENAARREWRRYSIRKGVGGYRIWRVA